MKFRTLANKVASGAVVATMLFSSIAPVAATVITADDGRYPVVPVGANAFVVEFRDTTTSAGKSLQDLYKAVYFAEYETKYELGQFVVYGNENVDEDGPDFDQANVDFTSIPNLEEWAVVVVDNGNTADTVYKTWADDMGDALDIQYKEILDIIPRLDENKLEDMYQDTMGDGADYATSDGTLEVDLTENFANTNAQIGDPDALAEAFDEVYGYIKADGEEYVFHMDVVVDDTHEFGDNKTEVQNLALTVRNQTGRVSFDLPEDPTGIVDFVVEVTDQDAANSFEYLTQNTVLFFPGTSQPDESDYNVTVTTVDAEGATSVGVDVEDYDETMYFETGDVPSEKFLPDAVGHTFEHHVKALYKLAIVDGYTDGDFGPDDDVTRAQLSKFVTNAFGIPMDLTGEMFPDVESGSSLFPYVQTLKNARIVGGYSNGNFGPDDPVTRGQATKFIYRAATFFDGHTMDLGGSVTFDDTSDSVFNDYIEALASYAQEDDNGLTDENDNLEPIIKGYPSGDFRPEENLTRGQMSKMVLNAASMVEKFNTDDDNRLEPSHLQGVFTISRDTDGAIADADQPGGEFDKTDALYQPDEYFFRPFIMPVAVDDMAVRQTPLFEDTSVDLEWDALHLDDKSIDGYIVEYKKSADGDDDWKEIETNLVAVDGTWDVTMNAAQVAGASVIVTVTDGNGNEAQFTYVDTAAGATAIATATDIAAEFNVAVANNVDADDVNGDAGIGTSTHDLDLDADGNGDDFDFAVTGNPIVFTDNADASITITGANVGDESLELANVEIRTTGGNSATLVETVSPTSLIAVEGMIFVDDILRDNLYIADADENPVDADTLPTLAGDMNPYANMVTIDGLSDSTKYEFRVSAFKYLPVGWTGEQDIDDIAGLFNAADDKESIDGVDYYEHLITGPWAQISKSTDSN